MIAANKCDVIRLESLSEENKQQLSSIKDVPMFEMSTVTEEGIMDVKNEACEKLLQFRVSVKEKTKKTEGILNRLHVAMPAPRDNKSRPPCIPDNIKEKRMIRKKLEKDIEAELGDDYILDLKKNYDLPEKEKYDIIPELWDGHNIADFIDPDILEKLEILEAEEALRFEAGMYAVPKIELDENMRSIRELAQQIRDKKKIMKQESRINKQSTKPTIPRNTIVRGRSRSVTALREQMENLGVELNQADDAHFKKRTRSRTR